MLKRKSLSHQERLFFLTLFPRSEERVGKRSVAVVSYRH
jgi:hypothetical protein